MIFLRICLTDHMTDNYIKQKSKQWNRLPTQQVDVPHKVVTVVHKKLDMDLYQFSII